jgi:hypothetical protein
MTKNIIHTEKIIIINLDGKILPWNGRASQGFDIFCVILFSAAVSA